MNSQLQVTEEQLNCLSQLAGIKITPGHVPGVIRNLEILFEQAALLTQSPIDALIEPAPVYRP